jgi:hypothetical protein
VAVKTLVSVASASALAIGLVIAPTPAALAADVPSAPVTVEANPTGSGEARLTWDAPVDPGSGPVTGYVAGAIASNGAIIACSPASLPSSARSCDWTGLTDGENYIFTVAAINAAGQGRSAADAFVIGVPSAPTIPAAVPTGSTEAMVTWQAPTYAGASPLTGYQVIAVAPNGKLATCPATTATSCTITGLTPGELYRFRFAAENSFGQTPHPSEVAVRMPTATDLPGAPRVFSGALIGPGTVKTTWEAPSTPGSSPITGYTMNVLGPGGSNPPCPDVLDAAARECTLTNLPNGDYRFYLTAKNSSGSGATASFFLTVVDVDVPSSPRSVNATGGDGEVTITWQAPTDTGGLPITGYEVLSVPDGRSCTVNALTCTITGLKNGTAYTFDVTASNAAGRSPSAASNAVTPAGPLRTPAPTTSWDSATYTMTVSWGPYDWNGKTPVRFEVTRSVNAGTTTNVALSTPLSESVVENDLSVGSSVEYRVRAISSDDTSPWGTVTALIPNPGLPVTVTAGDGSATWEWQPVAGASSYRLSYYSKSQNELPTVSCSSAPCTYTATGLVNGEPYVTSVRSYNSRGMKVAFTDPAVRFTPQAPAPTPLPAPTVSIKVTGLSTPLSAYLTWSPYNWGSYTKSRYEIRWTNNGGTTWNSVDNSTRPLAETATVSGLTPGANTRFEIRAIPATGAAGPWGYVAAVIPSPPEPFVLSAAAGDGQATLTWNRLSTPGLTYQLLNLSASPPLPPIAVPCAGTATTCSYVLTGLTNGTQYTYQLRASSTPELLSNQVTFSPVAPTAPLSVVYPTSMNLHVGQAVTISPDATYSSGNPTSFAEGSTPLPGGLTVNPTTGDITGTPVQAADGLFPIVVRNNQGQSLTVPLRLVIAPHTLALTYADHSGHVGSAFTLTPQISHPLGTVKNFRLVSGALPTGMVLDPTTGVISGTPTQATSGPVALVVSADDNYATARAPFTLTIDAGASKLSASYPNAVMHVGKAQGVTPTVSGATGTPVFTITSGVLPPGLALQAATGVVTGTPTAPQGATAITIQVTDGTSTDDVTFTIEVLAHTLTLAYPSSARDVGLPTQMSPVISHVEGSVSYAITSGTLPAGLSLDPATGIISGTPTQVTTGPVGLEITATDAYAAAKAAFTLAITDPTPALPVITGALTRDVDRLNVLGSVANASPGDLVTPMFKLTGQNLFTAGVPVPLDANGAFTWTRRVNLDKSAQVYFTIGGASSATFGAARPTVTVAGARSGTTATATGTVKNIRAGSVVHPWIKINGGKAIKGKTLTVDTTGAFTWTYQVPKGSTVRVKFNVRGVKSKPLYL